MLTGLRKNLLSVSILITLLMLATPAFAHAGHQGSGFLEGFLHPLFGADHLLAMIAIGLWAAQHTGSARWLLPMVFLLAMVAGTAIGTAGWMFAGMEGVGTASSVALLGLLIALAPQLPMTLSTALVSLFALVHGYAHGTEMPPGGFLVAYGFGFFAATALLYLLGFVLGLLGKHKVAAQAIRFAGAAISAIGMYWLVFGA